MVLHRYFYFWRGEFRFHLIFDISRTKFRQWAKDASSKHVRDVVKDQKIAEKLTPDFDLGCKRITPSDTYLQVIYGDKTEKA
jgi:cation diffusion facilitator CzcD-associated flavoprotein CzcO